MVLWLEHLTLDQEDGGLVVRAPDSGSRRWWFDTTSCCFKTWEAVFFHPILPVSFGRDSKIRWSLLPGEVKDAMRGVNVSRVMFL